MPGLNFEKRGEKGENSNINLGEYKPRDNFHPMGKLSGLDGLGVESPGRDAPMHKIWQNAVCSLKNKTGTVQCYLVCKTMFRDSIDEAVVPLMDFISHSFYLRARKANFVTQ